MTYKKKLIEVAIPLADISEAGAREQSIKRGKPTQLHKWWAGRPLVTCRAILWASLVDDPSSNPQKFPTVEDQKRERDRLFEIIRGLIADVASVDDDILEAAKLEIAASFPRGLPTVVDPFGGGGAIPLESQRLGMPTGTGDLNPVAVLLQRGLLEVPMGFAGRAPVGDAAMSLSIDGFGLEGIASDVEHYGRLLQDRAAESLGSAYPRPEFEGSPTTPVAWLWARTVRSPDPSWSGSIPLIRSWYLVKPGKRKELPNGIWVEPRVDPDRQEITYEIRSSGECPEGTINKSGGTCIATGAPIDFSYIRAEAQAGRMGQVLIAIVVDTGAGRKFIEPGEADRNASTAVRSDWRPNGLLPDGGLGFRVQNYGFDEWWKLFTDRQLASLDRMSTILGQMRDEIAHDCLRAGWAEDETPLREHGTGPAAYADAVVTYLAMALDRVADWNNSLCGWDNTNVVNQQLFRRQSISMIWDFCEILPYGDGAGTLGATLKTIRTAIEAIPIAKPGNASVANRDARARVKEFSPCVISTDPPYYDNIGYADLSDFFYVWLRRNLSEVWPDECATILTPKADELIADPSRHGGRAGANQHFESGMTEFMKVVCEAQIPEAPATVYYAFKASENSLDGVTSSGWSTFLQGVVDAGLVVTATWPVRTENKSRLRALDSSALATSVVLACRPRLEESPMATRGELLSALRSEMPGAIRVFQDQNIAPVDMAQSAMGPGIAIFSRYPKVVEADGSSMSVRTALALINEVLAEALSGEESEFDADTRFALTWFEQFGHNPGPAGDAITLATAKNTSVDGVATSGIASSRDGKFRLLDRGELDEGWDPANDSRLTVWEATQYLIRALDDSETAAADLLQRIGQGFGERARQLAYLLYGICDRNKWANEASSYNMLVTAWPEIERLSDSVQVDGTADDELQLF